jgi:hypothetical protein
LKIQDYSLRFLGSWEKGRFRGIYKDLQDPPRQPFPKGEIIEEFFDENYLSIVIVRATRVQAHKPG